MQPNILVIDDDPAILATVADILRDEGYTVQTAANGAEGLAAVERSPPMCVLLDMRMPVLDGWGFARALRDRGLNLPIVVMTAAQDVRRWAQEIGASHYLAKPFELLDLIAVVEQLAQAQ
jgi:two-component system chemotaxis response regulator CheY